MEIRNEIFEWTTETNLVTEPEIWDEAAVQLGVKDMRYNLWTEKSVLEIARCGRWILDVCLPLLGVTRWRSWLRQCTTGRKVAGSIPDRVIGIFHWHNPSGRTMALGLTQPLTGMSTRNTSLGAGRGRCVGLTNLSPSCTDCLEIWASQPPGTLKACPGLQWDCFKCA